jgi:hypothetical protein
VGGMASSDKKRQGRVAKRHSVIVPTSCCFGDSYIGLPVA